MGEKIRFTCQACGKKIGVPPSTAGKVGKCPGCGQPVRVPRPEEAPDPASLPFEESGNLEVALSGQLDTGLIPEALSKRPSSRREQAPEAQAQSGEPTRPPSPRPRSSSRFRSRSSSRGPAAVGSDEPASGQPATGSSQPKTPEEQAQLSFKLGLASLVCSCITGIPAIIYGVIALNAAKANGRKLADPMKAHVGICLGSLMTLFFFVLFCIRMVDPSFLADYATPTRPSDSVSLSGDTGWLRLTVSTDDTLLSAGDALAHKVYEAATKYKQLKTLRVEVELKASGGLVDNYGHPIPGPYIMGTITVNDLDEVRRYATAQAYTEYGGPAHAVVNIRPLKYSHLLSK